MFSNEQINLDHLPDFDLVNYEKLSEKSPIEQLISWSITYAIVGVIFVAMSIILSLPTELIISAWTIYLVLMGLTAFYIFASHEKRGVAVRENDILYRRGLFWRNTTIIPFNRIQHIESQQGPIERKLSLSTLKIFTAGGLSSDLQVSGLSSYRASQIRQLILSKTTSETDTAESTHE